MSVINGTSGSDVLTSGAGADLIQAGAGNDTINWTNAGSDTIDGGAGLDVLQYSNRSAQVVEITGLGDRAQILGGTPAAPGGPVSMKVGGTPPAPPPPAIVSLDNVEQVNVSVGVNTVLSVNNLVQSDINVLHFDIARSLLTPGGDTLVINAGPDLEQIEVIPLNGASDALSIQEIGFGATVHTATTEITHLTSADSIIINSGAQTGGIDVLSLTGRTASSPHLVLNGSAQRDIFHIAPWTESHLGAGDDDAYLFNATGHEIVDGGAGADQLYVTGLRPAADVSLLSGGGGHFILNSAATDVRIDGSDIESLNVGFATRGATVNVGNLQGSGLTFLAFDLGSVGSRDVIHFTGTTLNDGVFLSTQGNWLNISSLGPASARVAGAKAGDVVSIDTGAGNDLLDANSVTATDARIEIHGGAGADTLVGGSHVVLYGGDGNDFLYAGAHASTTFAFRAGETGVDGISGFRTSGPMQDLVDLDGYTFKYAANFAQFVAHNLVSDGHGGTNLITDAGQVIADFSVVAPNTFWPADFLIH